MNDWYYDEMRHVGTDYDNLHEVADYDERMSGFRDFDAEVQKMTDVVKPGKDDLIIEFGCGTGFFSIEMAKKCGKVIAVDISKKMLEFAAQRALREKIANIEFVHLGFLSYQHKDKPADSVITQLALHHLPDFWKFIALLKINTALKINGLVYISDVIFPFSESDDYNSLIKNMLEFFEKKAGCETAGKFKNHIKNEYSTFDWILEEMFVKAGFNILMKEKGEYFGSTYLLRKVKNSACGF